MKKKRTNVKKLRQTLIAFLLCAVVLGVSTYAWFIGMKKVNVESFTVDIATTEGLFLSMDGENWSYDLDAKGATPYADHTNTWAPTGLIPMSSVGDIDATSSTMMMYEKGSLTASEGGYRLLSSRVANFKADGTSASGYEVGNGYVAFDLFIKNLSGDEYYAEDNVLNEEGIYLNVNSEVNVTAGTDKEENSGIENSVRVAFAQIGRVSAETPAEDIANITGITCTDDTDAGVTGICRPAYIWEPNDTAHVNNAIKWYEAACTNRTGEDINDAASFDNDTECSTVADAVYSPTYAISRAIQIADNVDVYDGASYNGYTENTSTYAEYLAAEDKAKEKLVEYDYFTDTEKNIAGTARPEFMSLAPNSITKVRVYIYLEGQDIDNYDFASLGKQISVNFGFSKERYETGDITDYDGPGAVVGDNNDITP